MEQGLWAQIANLGFPLPVGTYGGQSGKKSLRAIAVIGPIIWVINWHSIYRLSQQDLQELCRKPNNGWDIAPNE